MARLPRIVVPGIPHHLTQRGNRRQRIFHGDEDYALYRDLLAGQSIGRPLMPDERLKELEQTLGQRLRPLPRGPRPRPRGEASQGDSGI